MPTIDRLVPAAVSADDDMLPVSQGGSTRKVTRAQLVAGLQPELAMSSGELLGRFSSGSGSPERVVLGANLSMVNGVLSSVAAARTGDLPVGAGPSLTDLVAVSGSGRDMAVPVRALLAGLSGVDGLDLSRQVAGGAAGFKRSLADWFGDATPVEAFGAVGDGVTDDQAAFDRAVASGRPVRLGPKTYVVNGQWTIVGRTALIGVAGFTVLRRRAQFGGAWIAVTGGSFRAIGIDFDAGGLSGDSWGVLVTPGCGETLFQDCVFRNSTGATLGNGLTIQARDGAAGRSGRHVVRDCSTRDNMVHGIWVQAAGGAAIEGCEAFGNGGFGICMDFNDPAFQQVVRNGQIVGCRAWGNARGISIGNFNETNSEPPRWGGAHPDAVGVLVSGNVCHDNTSYEIAVSGFGMQVCGNRLAPGVGGCGVLMNASSSRVAENFVSGPGQFGIDAGGCLDCDIAGNVVQGCAVGINPGGSRNVRVSGNRLLGNVWGITAYQIETDGRGSNFGVACDGLRLSDNLIQLRDSSGGGIFLIDGPQNVVITENDFTAGPGSQASQAIWAHTDSVVIAKNTWNSGSRTICNPTQTSGLYQVQYPDAVDEVMLTSASDPVDSIVGQHQAAMSGRISFIRLLSGGSGYTHAAVTVVGQGGGAAAVAHLRDGAVLGVALISGGVGYGGATADVLIEGDGAGARAAAIVGLPVPEGRRLIMHCNGPVQFKRQGSMPFQDNWTGGDVLVPAASEIKWVGTWGGWHATSFACANYLTPGIDGSVTVRSIAGDVALRPAGAGQVRFGTDSEPAGFVSVLGRGTPEGVIAAPAGSDFRNLSGGVGSTLWLKQVGSGTSGWVAIA